MQNVDVLLVNPGSRSAVYQGLGDEFSAIEPPSLAALFATYLRRRGQTVAMIDQPGEALSVQETARRATEDYKATLIVLVVYGFQPSASTQNMGVANEVARQIKEHDPKAKILFTGTHPAALPERTLWDNMAIDFVCYGEGPRTITMLTACLKAGREDYSNIPDLYWLDEGFTFSTPRGELIGTMGLDTDMPGAAWDLLPMKNYRSHNWHAFDHITERSPYASIHTSLGCPYHCSFCCINAPFGKSSYRMWSPETVVREIDFLYNTYGVRNIKFVDEMFVLNKAHVLGLCKALAEKPYAAELNIWAYARVDTVKDEFLDAMRAGGIRWLALGIESGSKLVRDGMEKGRFGEEEIIEVVRKIQAAGIYVIGNYIFGLPDDTHESMLSTYLLAREANCEFANFYAAMAYPGSKLYSTATQKGWKLPDSWLGYSQHSYETEPLPTETLSSRSVLAYRDLAFTAYFSNPDYLSMIHRKFGPEVVAHINRMVEHPLERRILAIDEYHSTS